MCRGVCVLCLSVCLQSLTSQHVGPKLFRLRFPLSHPAPEPRAARGFLPPCDQRGPRAHRGGSAGPAARAGMFPVPDPKLALKLTGVFSQS